MKTIHFKLREINSGFCRIHYTNRVPQVGILHYCFQENKDAPNGCEFLRCSEDGEPSHSVEKFKDGFKPAFELPHGKTPLESLVRSEIIRRGWIAVLAIFLTFSPAHADTYMKTKPAIGCYKNNTSNRCVDDTLIDCSVSLQEAVDLYGSVVASFCNDVKYLQALSKAKDRIVGRLLKQIKRLQRNK